MTSAVSTRRPTLDEVKGWPATVNLTMAARALGISPAWAYELAATGELPCRVLEIRGKRQVLTASLLAVLDPKETAAR